MNDIHDARRVAGARACAGARSPGAEPGAQRGERSLAWSRSPIGSLFALLVLLAPATTGEAAGVRVRWEHASARDFVVHLRQPDSPGDAAVDLEALGLAPDASMTFVIDVAVADAFAAVEVFVTALDADGPASDPSNSMRVTPAQLCGVRDCNDDVDCTDDLCDETGRCVHVADSGRCPDGEICTDDVCDPLLGCRWEANSRGCNDGRACTVADLCFAGQCAGSMDCPSGAVCDSGTGFCRRAIVIGTTTTTLGVPQGCGDGIAQPGELCDGGAAGWTAGRACRDDCTLVGCGDPDDSGRITASDALLALRAAAGAGICEPGVCNVDGSPGAPSAVDALRILQLAIGESLELGCPSGPTSPDPTG